MATTFTTWAALLTALKNDLAAAAAAHEFRVSSKSFPNGESVTFKTLDQLRGEIERVQALATAEADTQERNRYTPIGIRRAW